MLGNSLQIMDLTCPSLLMDKLAIHDETSDYGSKESSDREPHFGGLCQLLFQKGIEWLFYAQLHEHLEFNNTLFVLQKQPSSSEGPSRACSEAATEAQEANCRRKGQAGDS